MISSMKNSFHFQVSHSAELAVIQLVSQILLSFDDNKHTLCIFIDLSKVFDTAERP